MPSLEEYQAACKVIDDWIMEPDSDWNELKLHQDVQIHGILKALRYMLRTEQGESVLNRCATVMRRHDQMYAKLGNYGGSIKATLVKGQLGITSESPPHPGSQHG